MLFVGSLFYIFYFISPEIGFCYNVIDVDDILSDDLMPGNLLVLENTNRSGILDEITPNGNNVTTGSLNGAMLTMDFHRAKMNEYLCRNYLAEQIVQDMSIQAFSRRSSASPLTAKETLMIDEGSKSYKDWLSKSTTLEDIYRHYNTKPNPTQSRRNDEVQRNEDENEEYDTHVTNYVYEHPAKHTTYNLYGTGSGYGLPTPSFASYHPSNINGNSNYGTVSVHSYDPGHANQDYSPKYNKEKDVTDLFDIALTALAYLSFGMFIVHVVMCIAAVTSNTTNVVTMMPMMVTEPTGEGMTTSTTENGMMGGDMTMTGTGGGMTMTGNGGDMGMTMTGNGDEGMTGQGGGMTGNGNGGDEMPGNGNGGDEMTGNGNGGDGMTGEGGENGNGSDGMTGDDGMNGNGNGGDEMTGEGGENGNGGDGMTGNGNGGDGMTGEGGENGNGDDGMTGNGNGDDGMTGNGNGDDGMTGNGNGGDGMTGEGGENGNGNGGVTGNGNGGDGMTGEGGEDVGMTGEDGGNGNGDDGMTATDEGDEEMTTGEGRSTMQRNNINISTKNMKRLPKAEEENVRIKDNLNFRHKRQAHFNDANINELARKVLTSIEAALVANEDKGSCLRRQLCENNKFSRSLDNNGKIWIPVWSLGMSWLSGRLIKNIPPATSMLDGLKASILGLGKANCDRIYKDCNLYNERTKQKVKRKRSSFRK